MSGQHGTYRPLRWTGDAFVILDQTALPHDERYLECRTVDDVAAAIEQMRVRGAPAIGISAVAGLALALRERGADSDWRAILDEAARRLAATRPTAVDLFNALEVARSRVATARTAEEAEQILDRLVEELLERQWSIDQAIAQHGAGLLPHGARVLTHCNTGALGTGAYGTALGIIRRAHELGRLRHVWVTETRPRQQGARLTTWELRRVGIAHTLIVDGAAAWIMARGEVDVVIVGADRVAANGDVANKIGTLALAVAAERFRIPFYVAAPLSTFDPHTPDGRSIPIEERDKAEVLRLNGGWVAPADTTVLNPAFDVTPASLITGIVTEAGVVLSPDERKIAALLGAATRDRT
ncbi:S-methyl-5-thioribose-1-phosphate isomerase [Thermomicrobium sp. 4228-Ro]|uniref:S-methyl-5-thioribose-1-phosphate isomerase n=1 Tax=Thermomicrobium sp. 4228-Ro TaxID=2993937 RepID=UPI00224942A2|nr:S-methyl-5-thioribose-1-phosphate isomerase [Thermomicrobium sp. 4228-Ro]MCX2725952.1 S-methyl-5-thioribose-1-phosphate isomerase [Thermomicrobium sp. 4228-Ro]